MLSSIPRKMSGAWHSQVRTSSITSIGWRVRNDLVTLPGNTGATTGIDLEPRGEADVGHLDPMVLVDSPRP